MINSLLYSCSTGCRKMTNTNVQHEILEAERNFAMMVRTDGIAKAFYVFAADNAVIRRDSLYQGKEAIRAYYERQADKDVKLEWVPDFVDVSSSGDLGYTYGKFVYSATDLAGKSVHISGIFHTVWKKQADRTWKFVWD